MGLFFTSTQIFNKEQLNNKEFIDLFCNKMKEVGYVTCENDEAEKSYVLRFADNCKWVTITSEDYEQGNQTALNDTSRIAKMLNTSCVNTTVIASDCSVMELFDEDGNKADTLIMGRADDYFGESISLPSESEWKLFLSDGSSWEKVCEIINNSESYVFVEDGLSELAPLIGMDEINITFSFDEASEDDQTLFFHFKKDEIKKEKNLTLNAAFKQVFGELLEPMGFKLIKSKYPYYLRVVGEGVIQAVSISKEKSLNFDQNEEGFMIYLGISLLSLPLINFDKNPTIIDNQVWMISLNELFRRFSLYLENSESMFGEYSLFYKKGEIEEMVDLLKRSRDEFMPPVFDYFFNIQTLEDIYLASDMTGLKRCAIIILERVDEQIEKLKNDLYEELELLESIHAKNPVLLDISKENAIYGTNKLIKYYTSLKKGEESYDDYMKTAKETKETNLIILEKLGVIL